MAGWESAACDVQAALEDRTKCEWKDCIHHLKLLFLHGGALVCSSSKAYPPAHKHYPTLETSLQVPSILFLWVVRLTLWGSYKVYARHSTPVQSPHCFASSASCSWAIILPLLVEYAPVVAIMLLPQVAIKSKLEFIMGFFVLFPVYLAVFWEYLKGNLVPGSTKMNVKASSEAAGASSFPHLAKVNISLTVAISMFGAVFLLPQLGLMHSPKDTGVVLGVLVFTWYINWVRVVTTSLLFKKCIVYMLTTCMLCSQHGIACLTYGGSNSRHTSPPPQRNQYLECKEHFKTLLIS